MLYRFAMFHFIYQESIVDICSKLSRVFSADLSEDELYEVICCIEACQNIPMQRLDIHVLTDYDASMAQKISRSQFAILTRSLKSFIQQSEEQR